MNDKTEEQKNVARFFQNILKLPPSAQLEDIKKETQSIDSWWPDTQSSRSKHRMSTSVIRAARNVLRNKNICENLCNVLSMLVLERELKERIWERELRSKLTPPRY